MSDDKKSRGGRPPAGGRGKGGGGFGSGKPGGSREGRSGGGGYRGKPGGGFRGPRPEGKSGAPSEGRGERPQRAPRPRPEGEGSRAERPSGERRFSSFSKEGRSGGSGYGGKPGGGFRSRRPEGSSGASSEDRSERPQRAPRPRSEGEGSRAERPGGERRFSNFSKEGRPGNPDREGRPTGPRKPYSGPRKDRPAGMRGERDGKPRAAVSRRGDAVDLPDTIGGSERIARRLARAGIASRRDAEMLVETGRVSVNGTVLTSPAVNVTAQDRIEIDGEPIPAIERTRLLLFHKPAGVVTTNRDPEGRKTVFDVLPEGLPRLMTVGRLDINTEGLLLLTNDGGLARMLELPSTGWLRRYRVRVHGKVDERELQKLRDGVALEGVYYGSVEATLDREQGSNAWLTLGLREGKNREVKKILGSLGLDVTRLIRVSYGPFQLGELAEGTVQELKGRTLREQLGERLIADAGANFDAPIITPFSNSPVAAEAPRAEPKRQGRGRLDVEDGGLVRARNKDRLDRLDRRDKALGRLQTRRPDASRDDERKPRAEGKPRGEGRAKPVRKADRDGPPMAPERPGSRSSYVWMAPGARPDRTPSAGSDKPAREEGRTKPSGSPARPQGKGRPPRQDGGRPTRNDGPRKPAGPRGAKPGRGPKGR